MNPAGEQTPQAQEEAQSWARGITEEARLSHCRIHCRHVAAISESDNWGAAGRAQGARSEAPRWTTRPARGFEAPTRRRSGKQLSEALKGWWKLARPLKAWGLYRKLRATSEASRRRANERLLRKRLADPALASLNEDQRRAVIVQEDRTLVVAGAGTGKTHTMVAKARDTVRTGVARPEEIAFVTFTRKAAQEIRDRSGDLPGMEIGTIHHLARAVIMRVEGRKPRLSPLVEDETRRLTELEAWLLEALQDRSEPAHRPRNPTPSGLEVPRTAGRGCRRGCGCLRTRCSCARWARRALRPPCTLADSAPTATRPSSPVPEEHQGRRTGSGTSPTSTSRTGRRSGEAHTGPQAPTPACGSSTSPTTRTASSLSAGTRTSPVPRQGVPTRTRVVEGDAAPNARHPIRVDGVRRHPAVHARLGRRSPTSCSRASPLKGRPASNPRTEWDVRSVIEQMKAEDGRTEHMRATYEIDAWIRTRRQQVRNEATLMEALAGRDGAEESSALWRLARPVLERYVRHLVATDTTDHEGTILKGWRYLRDGAMWRPRGRPSSSTSTKT